MNTRERDRFLVIARQRDRENKIMLALEADRLARRRHCPCCLKDDLWLPIRREMDDGYFPSLIRLHCNHCGCEWNPYWNCATPK